MSRRAVGEPRLAKRVGRLVLAARVPRSEREYVAGDLREGYEAELAARGSRRAHGWYWRQLGSLMVARWGGERVETHRRRGGNVLSSLMGDLRFAVRSLVRAPLFTLLVVLTLAIGIGATSAIFSVVQPVVLAAPPYRAADRLVMVWERASDGGKDNLGYLTGDDIRRETTVLSSLAMMSYWSPTLRVGDDTRPLTGARVSAEYFRTLGVAPALGRDFTAAEDAPETRRVVILSDGLWRRQFGADSAVVGGTALIGGTAYVIAGVMPADFRDVLSPQAEIWSPLGYDATLPWACRTCHHLRAVARLRDGVTHAEATAAIDGFMRTLRARHPDEYALAGALVPTLHAEVAGEVRPVLLGIFGAVLLLLLLACANVASLCLGRTAERQSELAVRRALGAEAGRLIRLVSVESAVLAVVGGALGVLTAWVGTRALLATLEGLPAVARGVTWSTPQLAFAVALTAASALAAGVLPALVSLRGSAVSSLKAGGRALMGRTSHRVRHTIVVGEVALAVLLLAAAGLQVRSLQRALDVRTGFDPEGVVTMQLTVTGPGYAEEGATFAYYRRLLDEVSRIDVVDAVAVVSQLPLGGNFDSSGVHREDAPAANPMEDPSAQRFAISPAYLEVMGIDVLRGRGIGAEDRAGSEPVVLLNRTAAARIFEGVDPIGRRIKIGGMDGPWRTVVGIVEDVRHLSLEGAVESQMYLPFDQNDYEEGSMVLVARARGVQSAAVHPLVRAVKAIDAGVAISEPRDMNGVIARMVAPRRLALSLVGGFAVIALVLAVGGLYGVMAASVAERVREMGLRSALGATGVDLIALVVGRGVLLTLAGTALGAAGFLAIGRILRRFIFGVSPGDPVTLLGVAALLCIVGLIACALPAWRAARADPMEALRA